MLFKKKETNLAKKSGRSKVKSNKTIIAMAALTIGSAFALSSATYAWFCLSTGSSSSIDTFSGDIDVSIEKVTAYKYVYPYINNSTEFIDYEGAGEVKSYVVEDASIEEPSNLSDTVTFALGTNASAHTYATTSGDANKGPTKIHYENSQIFQYYLLGNNVFTGVSTDSWSTLTGVAFSRTDVPVVGEPVIVENVVVSAGAEFILFDVHTVNAGACNYFTYGSPTTPSGNSRFSVLETNRLKCLKSGIYKFQYRIDGSGNYFLDIILTSRSDNAIIGTNLIDPTKITIDYRGSYAATYNTIDDYLPIAIQDQNTMVVLDVELKYENENAVDTGLKIVRTENTHSIYNYSGQYNTTNSYTYTGYVDDSHRNPLNASDFYAFYCEFTADSTKYATPTAAWEAFHDDAQADFQTIAGKKHAIDRSKPFNKFENDGSDPFESELVCDVYEKELTDSKTVPGGTDDIYHCYIAIDYDYEHMVFFVNQNRVGKTYLLDRDFQLYFTAEQHLEVTPSPLYVIGGEE